MNIRTLLFSLLLICSISTIELKAQVGLLQGKEILPASKETGRLDAVLNHVAMIRVQPEFKSLDKAQRALAPFGIRILAPFLKPEQSLAYQFEKNNPDIQTPTPANRINDILRTEEPLLRTYIIEYSGNDSPELFCLRAGQHCDVIEIAEPYYLPALAGGTPNDSLLPLQNTLKTMKAIEAWNIYEGDSTVVIAISDAGTMQDHEDIFGSLWVNANEIPGNRIDDDGNGYTDDYQGYNFAWKDDGTAPGNTYNKIQAHGTYTAGIAGATANNHIGICGAGNKCIIFPLKCTSENNAFVISYGYQSIIYAVLMGFDVINCSWTSFNHSCINQSVIDYALSKNLVVVAAAGNGNKTTSVFPASYKGVLGVGITNENDFVMEVSGLATNASVMAPGHRTWSTSFSDKEYFQISEFAPATSFASPLAAGVMGLVRSRQPLLSARQAVEFTRLCTDNIEDLNPAYRGKIGGRLNMLKAVTLDPMSFVAIRPEEVSVRSDSGFTRLFGSAGYNTGSVSIRVKNYLGAAKSVSYHVSTLQDSLHLTSIIDSNFSSGELTSDGKLTLNAPTGIRISSAPGATPFLLRVDISAIGIGGDTTRDFFLTPITPFPAIYTHHNTKDTIVFSISDDGNIGYSDFPRNQQGVGFRYGGECTYLIEGGILASDGKAKVVSQVRNASRQRDTHFSPVVQFNAPEGPLYGIVSDSQAPDSVKLGITVRERLIPNTDASIVQLNMKAARTSSEGALSLAHYFNWNLGGLSDRSSAKLFSEVIPDSIKSRAAAVLIQSDITDDVIACAVVSCNPEFTPICTAFDDSLTQNGFTNSEKIAFMSGTVRSEKNKSGEVGVVIGMKIQTPPVSIEPNSLDDYALFIAAGKSVAEVSSRLSKAISSTCSTLLDVDEQPISSEMKVIPSPANDEITINAPAKSGRIEIRIHNVLGEDVIVPRQFFNETSVIHTRVDVSSLSSGTYYVIIRVGNEIQTAAFIKQ